MNEHADTVGGNIPLDTQPQAPAERAPRVVIIQGPDKGKVFPLSAPRTIVGRAKAAAIALNDDRVSRRHCVLVVEDGVASVVDLGSRNGTRVDGREVRKAVLSEALPVRVGKTTFRVLLDGASDLTEAP